MIAALVLCGLPACGAPPRTCRITTEGDVASLTAYDPGGHPIWIGQDTDGDGAWDAIDQRVRAPDGRPLLAWRVGAPAVTRFGYDAAGREILREQIDPDGRPVAPAWRTERDEAGRVVREGNDAEGWTLHDRDEAGREIGERVLAQGGRERAALRIELGSDGLPAARWRRSEVRGELGAWTIERLERDPSGRLAAEIVTAEGDERPLATTRWVYNADGRPIERRHWDADGVLIEIVLTRYGSDGSPARTERTDPRTGDRTITAYEGWCLPEAPER